MDDAADGEPWRWGGYCLRPASLWTQESAAALAGGPRRHAREGREALPTLPGLRLHFAGGDTLAAELRSWTTEGLELRTPWGQELLSDLRNLREIYFLPSEERVLLDGPAALTEWQTDFPGKPSPRRIGNELGSHTELYNVICARLPGAEGPLELVVCLRRPPEVRDWGLHLFNANAHNRRGRDSLNLDLRGRQLSLFVNQTLVLFPSGGTPANAPPVWLTSGPARARLRLGTVSWDAEQLTGTSPHFEMPLRIPLGEIDEIAW